MTFSSCPSSCKTSTIYRSDNSKFPGVRLAFIPLILVALSTGIPQILFSTDHLSYDKCSMSESILKDPLLNSEYRFLASMYLAYASLAILIISDVSRYRPVVRVISAHLLLAALGRTYTIFTLGIPECTSAKMDVLCSTTAEYVVSGLLWALLNVESAKGKKGVKQV